MAATTRRGIGASLLAAALVLSTPLWPGTQPLSAAMAVQSQVVALPGYQVSLFAAPTAAYSNPDSIVVDGPHVFVGYANKTAKDGTDHKSSTIVEYTMQGTVVRTFSVLGHNDGLRLNPVTHLLWALSDEDGNPHLTTIDPATGATTLYHFASAAHGGGFDDMAFVNGMALVTASNPTLNKGGVNVFPALDKAVLNGRNVIVTPVLMGNARAMDVTTGHMVTLNEIDPDSLSVDRQGNVVMDNQAGAELLFLRAPGTARQAVSRLPLGTQVDDTVWAASPHGQLLVVDQKNGVYSVRTTFTVSTVYAAAPADSGVAGFVGTLNPKTGTITPIIIGLPSPHGMTFIAGM